MYRPLQFFTTLGTILLQETTEDIQYHVRKMDCEKKEKEKSDE